MVVAACGGCGLMMAANYRREEQMLRQLEGALREMVSELSCRMTTLPLLVRRAGNCAGGELKKVFLELAEELDIRCCPDGDGCMRSVLDRHPCLPKSIGILLAQLGRSLGQFDLEGQLRELEAVSHQCGQALSEHAANRESRIRNYQTLGLCAGGALAILLL